MVQLQEILFLPIRNIGCVLLGLTCISLLVSVFAIEPEQPVSDTNTGSNLMNSQGTPIHVPHEMSQDHTNDTHDFEMPMFMDDDPFFTWKEYQQRVENPIFSHGEILQYNISWMGISAGTITMELIVNTDHDGNPVYKVVVTGATNRAFSVFFKVRDVVTAYFDPITFNSLFYSKNIREGRYRKYKETRYDPVARKAYVNDSEYELPPNSRDPVTCIYALRRFKPEENIVVRMNSNSEGKDNYPFKIGFSSMETVVLGDRVQREAIQGRHLPTFEGRVFEKGRSEVIIWFSHDPYAVPLKLETKIRIGTLRGELIKRSGPGWELDLENER